MIANNKRIFLDFWSSLKPSVKDPHADFFSAVDHLGMNSFAGVVSDSIDLVAYPADYLVSKTFLSILSVGNDKRPSFTFFDSAKSFSFFRHTPAIPNSAPSLQTRHTTHSQQYKPCPRPLLVPHGGTILWGDIMNRRHVPEQWMARVRTWNWDTGERWNDQNVHQESKARDWVVWQHPKATKW